MLTIESVFYKCAISIEHNYIRNWQLILMQYYSILPSPICNGCSQLSDDAFWSLIVCMCVRVSIQRSVDLNPAQRDLVLKVAELLVSKTERDNRAEFWVEKAAKLLPGHLAVFNLKVRALTQY